MCKDWSHWFIPSEEVEDQTVARWNLQESLSRHQKQGAGFLGWVAARDGSSPKRKQVSSTTGLMLRKKMRAAWLPHGCILP